MNVLVDTSIWISYFRGDGDSRYMDILFDENLIATNDLILTELIPFLKIKKQRKLINLLKKIDKYTICIDWDGIINMQVKCVRNGINGIGIPDLITAQNAIQNNLRIYSEDKHFRLVAYLFSLKTL